MSRTLRRHRRDAVSLAGGLLFTLIAGWYLLADTGAVGLDLRWLAPAALISLGMAGLVGTMRRPSRGMEPGVEGPDR